MLDRNWIGLFLSTHNSDVCCESVHIDPQVYSGICKGVHATRVLCPAIHMVDANGISTELLHKSSIQLALVCVDERVLVGELVGNT
jgi:hypothetical protein